MKLSERIAALVAKYKQRVAEEVEGDTDAELRGMLHDALFAEEAGFLGIEAVMPEEKKVIYAVAPEGTLVFFMGLGGLASVPLADARRKAFLKLGCAMLSVAQTKRVPSWTPEAPISR